MPRRTRHFIAHQPYHVVQRGDNREACFIELENYQFYIELWKELSKKYGIYVAGMVEAPEEYRWWTSYHVNAWGDAGWLAPHDEYNRLGNNTAERCYAYRELFRFLIDSDELHKLRKSIHYCQPLGDEYFAQKMVEHYGLQVGRMTLGRPRKTAEVKVD